MRTFIAIELDAEIKRQIGRMQERLRAACPGLRFVRPEQIHLTLHFLGDIEDRRVPSISAALDRLGGEIAPLEFGIGGVGVFPPRGPARVAWVGVRDESRQLANLHRRCGELLEECNVAVETRPFSPHLTLARCGDQRDGEAARREVEAMTDDQFGVQEVEEVVFFQSVLGAKGATHTALSRHELRGYPTEPQP